MSFMVELLVTNQKIKTSQTMKVRQKKNRKKLVIAIIILVVLVVAGFGYLWYSHHFQIWPFTPKDTETVELNNSDSTNPQTKNDANKPVKGVDPTKSSSEIPVSKDTTIKLTSLTQDGQQIVYSASITNPASTGVCSATFTKDGSQPVTKTDTISGNECGPFYITATSFDSIGTWTLTLRYYANDVQAVATSTIEVK